MARFNRKNQGTKTINLAGGSAFKQPDKLELVSLLLTSFVQDQFYRSSSKSVKRLQTLIQEQKDKKFIAKAAIYARKKFGMRSITHIAAGEIGKSVKGESWTKGFFEKVINRPDDITETLSYYLSNYGFPLPRAMMKGFKKKLESLNEYQLAKYKGENKDLKMVDVVNLLHPKATPALTKLMKGELKNTETWEAKLSEAGQTGDSAAEVEELKGAAWKELLSEKKLGYFALLRNLRNIAEQAPDVLELALEQLVDAEAIKKSLVLPFRFYTAAKTLSSLSNSRKIILAISKALEVSLSNCPELSGKTCVVLDCSGSMTSGKCGTNTCFEIGALFASMLYKRNDADLMLFSDNATYVNADPSASVLSMTKALRPVNGGTDFTSIFNTLNRQYERVIILSDMQGLSVPSIMPRVEAYKRRFATNPKIFSFDLTGHGTLQFPYSNVYCLAGFSDKIFDIMGMLESDKNALLNEIEKIEI